MNTQKIEKFSVIGIAVRTSNENGQAMQDIPALWDRFMSDGIADKIPNKIDKTIYSIYTEYERDHTKPYTAIIACKVESLETVPAGMIGKEFDEGNYTKHTAKGNLQQGIVYDEWMKIWNSVYDRMYTADFEVYGEKTQNPENAEVDIFVAVA